MKATEEALKEAESELESRTKALETSAAEESKATKAKTKEEVTKYKVEVIKARKEKEQNSTKVAELLAKLEDLYKLRLELSKSEVSATEQDLETLTDRLRMASEEVTSTQTVLESLQSRKASGLGEKEGSKKRAAPNSDNNDEEGEEAESGEKRQKQS